MRDTTALYTPGKRAGPLGLLYNDSTATLNKKRSSALAIEGDESAEPVVKIGAGRRLLDAFKSVASPSKLAQSFGGSKADRATPSLICENDVFSDSPNSSTNIQDDSPKRQRKRAFSNASIHSSDSLPPSPRKIQAQRRHVFGSPIVTGRSVDDTTRQSFTIYTTPEAERMQNIELGKEVDNSQHKDGEHIELEDETDDRNKENCKPPSSNLSSPNLSTTSLSVPSALPPNNMSLNSSPRRPSPLGGPIKANDCSSAQITPPTRKVDLFESEKTPENEAPPLLPDNGAIERRGSFDGFFLPQAKRLRRL